jgi:glycosyltransferase involved in cell wall biosynthesis
MSKITIIILTWQRMQGFGSLLSDLNNQTHQDFEIIVSHGNLRKIATVEKYVNSFKNLNIKVRHDGNDQFTFRRLGVAQEAAQNGSEIILFLDDDVALPNTYLENAIKQYRPFTYQSGYAWYFTNRVSYYNSRVRVSSKSEPVHYCGTGLAIADARLFLDKRLFDAPECAYKIEDLWLSYFANHVLGWDLGFIDTGANVFGRDAQALSKQVRYSECNKDTFFSYLTLTNDWQLSLPQDTFD